MAHLRLLRHVDFNGIERLLAAVETILAKQKGSKVAAKALVHTYDKHEHYLEQQLPHRSFRSVAGEGLRLAMMELGLSYDAEDVEILTSSISRMPPFPEVVEALGHLKRLAFRTCIIS